MNRMDIVTGTGTEGHKAQSLYGSNPRPNRNFNVHPHFFSPINVTTMRLSRFCFSSTVLLACTALLMIQAGAEKVSVSAKFFLRLCDAKHRGCFLGAFGVSMHSGEPGSENCKDSCVIFPAFKSRYKCGKCSPASAPTRPPVTNPGPAPAQVTAPATAPSTGTKPVTAPSTGTTPVTTPSSVLVTGAPFAAPSPGFNMTLGFDNIPAGDIQFFHKASARWERVITSDFPSFNSSGYTKIAPNCAYPEMIDDMYVCVYYTDITEPEVVGYGGPILRRTSRTTTLTGMIKLKLGLFPEGQPPSYLQSLITHELGHAMVSSMDETQQCRSVFLWFYMFVQSHFRQNVASCFRGSV